MKFTPETLLQIYLNGSFTEEAQAEFDALVRRDPLFAEKVTQAVGERLGPVPEGVLEDLSARLEARSDELWRKYKPSPWERSFRMSLKVLAGLSALAALALGYHRWWIRSAEAPMPAASTLQGSPAPLVRDRGAAKRSLPGAVPRTQGSMTQDRQGTSAEGAGGVDPRAGSSLMTAEGDRSLSPAALKDGKTGSARTGNSLRVAIDTQTPGPASVWVYDSQGSLVRHLFEGMVEPGEHYVDWDGKDDLGRPVRPGDYNVVLDLSGKKMSGVLKILSK